MNDYILVCHRIRRIKNKIIKTTNPVLKDRLLDRMDALQHVKCGYRIWIEDQSGISQDFEDAMNAYAMNK